MHTETDTQRSVFFPDFFKGSHFFIDEKVGLLRFSNAYKVYNEDGDPLGRVTQQVSGWHKFLRLFLKKQLFPFSFQVIDNHEQPLLTVSRGWTFWMSQIVISNEQGEAIGFIKQQFRLLKARFKIYDEKRLISEINGDWKGWNFSIIDNEHTTIGAINKQWAGLGKELFTTADKYHVALDGSAINETEKKLILAAAITIDMVLKESR